MSQDYTQISDHVSVLRRRGWIIVLTGMLGAIAGALLSTLLSPTYTATAVVLAPPPTSEVDATEYVATQAQVVESDEVVTDVASRLGLDTGTRELLDSVSIEVVESTTTLSIRATGTSPSTAADLANAFAESYLEVSATQRVGVVENTTAVLEQDLEDANATLLSLRQRVPGLSGAAAVENRLAIARVRQQQDRINTALSQAQDPALQPGQGRVLQQAGEEESSTSQVRRSVLFGLVLGLLLGTAIAYARHHRDDRLHGEDELAAAAPVVPVLARVPVDRTARRGGSGALQDRTSPTAEAYRTLATNLRFRLGLGTARDSTDRDGASAGAVVVAITSARPGEGKTSVAINLAVSAARNGLRVVLVDADLRKPQVAARLGLDADQDGLADALQASPADAPPHRCAVGVANLLVVTSGRLKGRPYEALASARAAAIWRSLGEQTDLVVLDTAPVLHASETLDVAAQADHVVLVVERGKSRARDLRATAQRLDLVGTRLTGVVLNRVRRRNVAQGYGTEEDRRGGRRRVMH